MSNFVRSMARVSYDRSPTPNVGWGIARVDQKRKALIERWMRLVPSMAAAERRAQRGAK